MVCRRMRHDVAQQCAVVRSFWSLVMYYSIHMYTGRHQCGAVCAEKVIVATGGRGLRMFHTHRCDEFPQVAAAGGRKVLCSLPCCAQTRLELSAGSHRAQVAWRSIVLSFAKIWSFKLLNDFIICSAHVGVVADAP